VSPSVGALNTGGYEKLSVSQKWYKIGRYLVTMETSEKANCKRFTGDLRTESNPWKAQKMG